MKKFTRRFRLPAEWLLTEREEKISDFYGELNVLFFMVLMCLFFVATLFFGHIYSRLVLLYPYIIGATLLVGLAVSCVRLRKKVAEIHNLNKGIDGEKIVAAQLEPLKESGYRIFSDLQLGESNVDFAVIGPGGVYAVEVKNHSHPLTTSLTYINEGYRGRCLLSS